tara:strand:+ start:7389 stop:7598 length:210 start_codon:yes stop_codon:yes gene_type:complete
MGAVKSLLDIEDKDYRKLKREYLKNLDKESFIVFEQEVLVKFAQYWIEALEDRRKARGLPIYKPKINKG